MEFAVLIFDKGCPQPITLRHMAEKINVIVGRSLDETSSEIPLGTE